MVFDGLKEKIEERVVFGALKKLPENMRTMARASAMNKSIKALDEIELKAKNLLAGLKVGEFSGNNLVRDALKVREFVKDNKRLYSSEGERKNDLKTCNELVDGLIKEENVKDYVPWLESFILRFPEFKKALFLVFDKLLPI